MYHASKRRPYGAQKFLDEQALHSLHALRLLFYR